MSWQDQLQGDSLSWLLESDSPGARYLAMRDLLDLDHDSAELAAARELAHQQGPIKTILAEIDSQGFWVEPGPGYNPKYRSTVWCIIMLAQLGASLHEDQRISRACDYVLEHALAAGGRFSASGAPSGTADCLQGNLCWALFELGVAPDRLHAAFDWMARSITGEGIAPISERQAALRYYAGNCGPSFACGSNNKLPCAWGGVKEMLALSAWPADQRTEPIRHAITQGAEFLLGPDPALAAYPTGYSDKPSSNWWKFGFPVFYVTDLLQNVEALVRLGYASDPRLTNALDLIRNKQDDHGRWSLDYDYRGKTWVDFGPKGQANKWVTLRALRVLKTAEYAARM
jgi:hypothetical protein